MLTSCKLTGAPQAVSAYHTKEENYYFAQASGVEAVSKEPGACGIGSSAGAGRTDFLAAGAQGHIRVHGKLCPTLGLRDGGEISQAAFTNLLSGRDAAGNQVTREHKVHGIDLVFSAPKTVSIAGLLTARDPRIVEAHDRAVAETMREVEAHCSGTRVWPKGEMTPVKTDNLAYVTVRDGFNRDHDPHLHTHVIVMNLTEHKGKVLSLDGRLIMRQDFNKAWGAMYRAKLAAHLKELGYSVSYTKKGELRLDVVSLEVEREFSGRRAEIQARKELGARDMEAWRETRKDKAPEIVKADVLAGWRDRVAKHQQKTAEENRHDTILAREQWFKEATWSVEARQELAGERRQTEASRWQVAARRATEHEARASSHAVITEYLTELARSETWNPITYTEAEQRLHEQVNSGNLLATDDGCFTTWELARADRECVESHEKAAAGLAMGRTAAAGKVAAYREAERGAGRRGLSGLQAEAAAGILSGASGTVVVQGDAGAGKTTMLKAVNDLAAGQGWEVKGVAVQGVAARKLQEESGIESTTLASYLARERAPAAGPRGPRLVVVDEASMLGSRDLSALLRTAAEHKDKVVLVGDRNQIQSVGAGKPFDRLVEDAKQSGRLLNLSENYRQRNAQLRQAVDLARNGHMRESLARLNENHKIQEIEGAAKRRAEVARLYDKDTLVVTGSRQSREELNNLIRENLTRKGELSAGRAYTLTWQDEDGVKHSVKRELAAGERVVFLQNEYKDYDVRNGEVGTVTKTGKNTLGVRLEDGRQVELDLARYSALDYGYALTTYKSQGQTYDKVVVEADTSTPQLQDQRNTYVQITRAREDVRIVTDDFFALQDLAGVLTVKQDTHDPDLSLAEAKVREAQVRENVLFAARLEAPSPTVRKSVRPGPAELPIPPAQEGSRSPLPDGAEQQALSLRARQEASAKAAQVPPLPAAADREEIRPAGTYGTSDTAGEASARKALEAAEWARTRAIASGEEKDRLAWEKAEKIAQEAREAAPGAADRAGELKVERDPEFRVHNQALVDSSADKAACFLQFRQLEERLRQRQDLTEAEKHRVAEQLGRRESIHNLEAHILSPNKAIAAALVASGTRDFHDAARGLPDRDKDRLLRFLNDEQVRNERWPRAAAERAEGRSDRRDLGIDEAARELKEAQAAEKAAAESLSAADESYKEASREWKEAQAWVGKAWLWEKKTAQAHEEEARHGVDAASWKHGDAMTVWGAARERLTAAQDEAQSRAREAEARAAEAARLERFQGTKETVAKAAKTASEVQEAGRKLAEARVERGEAHRGFEAERHKYDDLDLKWHNAQSRVWQAGERVRTAPLWEKKEARAEEKAEQRKIHALENGLNDVKAARDAALKREYAAGDRLKAAEAAKAAAEKRAAEAARTNELQATRQALRARADLTPAEQQHVEECLGRAANAAILRDCDDPKQAIAAGLIASGTRNAKEATKGMEKPDATKVVEAVEHNREIEKERRHERDLSRDRGRDRGLEFYR